MELASAVGEQVRVREGVDVERAGGVAIRGGVVFERADAHLESKQALASMAELLVPFFNTIIFIYLVFKANTQSR